MIVLCFNFFIHRFKRKDYGVEIDRGKVEEAKKILNNMKRFDLSIYMVAVRAQDNNPD